jgi:hypothetical protein
VPTYAIKNKKTGEVWTDFFTSWSRFEEYMKFHPDFEQELVMPAIISGTSSQKPDSAFRDFLKHTKERNPGSTVNDFGGGSDV